VPPGLIVGCRALGFSRSCHLPSFGLTVDGSCGLLLVCHSFGKKWASTPIKHGNNKALKTNDAESGNVVEN
jgi:hypothetical protein